VLAVPRETGKVPLHLMSTARQIVSDAEAEYLAFFASKTVAMIRAPDTYVYPAPFNLVEIFLIVPFESVYSKFLLLLHG
jgi:hypothetical protein